MTEPHLDHPSLDGLNRLSASPDEVGEALDYAEVSPDDEGDGDETSPTSAAKRHARGLLDWIVVIGIALLVAFVVRTFVLAHFVVDGESMMTTLHDGDRVFVNKLSYRLHDPNRGDVVVLHEMHTGVAERDLIKRVIALEGETIEMRNCEVRIDGEVLEEPYLDPVEIGPENLCGGDFGPEVVPEDHVFVMGDNRDGSQDSRAIDAVSEDDIVGRAFVVIWPTGHWRWL
jgi:signal peptidase I